MGRTILSITFKRKLLGAVCALMIAFSAMSIAADQQDYDSRKEQQLRTHDFDVKHYRIALSLEESTRSFDGETVITFSATVDGFSKLFLDAEAFKVSSVKAENGSALKYTQSDGKLVVDLDDALAKDEESTLIITYSATNTSIDPTKASRKEGNIFGLDFQPKTETNPQLIKSLNFPDRARYWFPSFDHPSDWATHETIITTKAAYKVLANGSLISDTKDTVTGRRTFHWSQVKPQPTYLYVFVAGTHSVIEDKHGDLPLHYWVYPGDEEVAKELFKPTPKIVAFLEDLYDTKYPFVKYDQIIVPGRAGGAESTSATLLGDGVIKVEREGKKKGANDWLIAHELAHHWWGDIIGYKDWGHNWLAESFSSHGEYLYLAHAFGADEGALYLDEYKALYLNEAKESYMRPVVTNKWDNPNNMFDHHAYEKGAVILNMFREMVGKDMFTDIMKNFLNTHAYSSVTTGDFFEKVKQITKKDYNWFFDQWLLSPGHPVLDVSYDWDAQKKSISMTVKQKQDTSTGVPIFHLPIKVGITTSAGKKVESVWLKDAEQTFTFDVDEKPLLVRFDEGDILLKEWTFEKSVEELLYQLKHDNVIGRLWAVSELAKHKNMNDVQTAL